MWRIAHLTSVHPRHDTRIFVKQCRSLAEHGYDVTLVVADDKGDEYKDGVQIVDVGRLPGRLNRILRTTRRVFDKAVELDADIYQFHDPELLTTGLKLKQLGKKVIFDSHEDAPKQILNKPYLNPTSLRLLSGMMARYESFACHRFDGIIAATPFIRDKFLSINPNTVDVNNFPLLGELHAVIAWTDKRDEVCFIGGIDAIRGIDEVVRACALLKSPVRLNLAGSFSERPLEAKVKAHPGWGRVNELGYLDRAGVCRVLGRSIAGLVTSHPIANFMEGLPVKMFEYMAAAIPVIASNIPLWREIVEGNDCGLCVDPYDPAAIANAIDYLALNPDVARRMGENGRQAVMQRYNWPAQVAKLTNFYGAISNDQ
ncbi:glycosyltransferase family 4 protein [Undibacterium arcticum]|uniref:Glycosyltransferase family 4 protein n=2 Tax=Undibacterium arcticum TaxID=1762892 RepID=A0ABV7F761_9BURK